MARGWKVSDSQVLTPEEHAKFLEADRVAHLRAARAIVGLASNHNRRADTRWLLLQVADDLHERAQEIADRIAADASP